MKTLLTGANGFVGNYLTRELLAAGHQVIATGKGPSRLAIESTGFIYEAMDFTDPYAVHDVFQKHLPEAVIHAGAMAKPDICEQHQWQSYVTNVEGTLTLLSNANEHRSYFVFLSTDFVFDGKAGPYSEADLPNPVNFYGRTKLEAEEAVKEYTHGWSIVRTVLVYGDPGEGRNNFITMVKSRLEQKQPLKIFDDQFRTPTYVGDLARGITSILSKKATGVFHISGDQMTTPYRFACMTAEQLGLDSSLIQKITKSDLSEPATRPPKTGFIIQKARTELGFEPLGLEEGIERVFRI